MREPFFTPGALYAATRAGQTAAWVALLYVVGFVGCLGLGAIFHQLARAVAWIGGVL